MSEEEKKAIEILKEAQDRMIKPKMLKDVKYTNEDYAGAIDTILNLIDKQQKEIEELKNTETYKIAIIDKDKYISKDKIREKIKKLEKTREMLTDSNGMIEISASIDILKELLGEKINY